MKTNEFIYQVNQIDGRWSVDDYGPSLVVRTSRTKRETISTDVLWVSKSETFKMQVHFQFNLLKPDDRETLMKLVMEYTATPVQERRDRDKMKK